MISTVYRPNMPGLSEGELGHGVRRCWCNALFHIDTSQVSFAWPGNRAKLNQTMRLSLWSPLSGTASSGTLYQIRVEGLEKLIDPLQVKRFWIERNASPLQPFGMFWMPGVLDCG